MLGNGFPHGALLLSVSEEEAHRRLCSDSVLLIRRDDVLRRATPDCSLSGLSENQSRWRVLDVEGEAATSFGAHFRHAAALPCFLTVLVPVSAGQVQKMILEEEQEGEEPKRTHITIPAAYSSGVTLFTLRDSELGQEVLRATDIPLL